jgi:hypothetical protein
MKCDKVNRISPEAACKDEKDIPIHASIHHYYSGKPILTMVVIASEHKSV